MSFVQVSANIVLMYCELCELWVCSFIAYISADISYRLMNYSDSHTHKCITVFQSTSDQAQITAEWIAAALKQITDELHQLAASLDARKAADNARVSV